MDERSSSAAVAIDEGVDGLELGVGQRGPRNGRQRVVVSEGDEIVEQRGDHLRWERDDDGGAWVVVTTTDPVLLRADLAAMDFKEVVERDRSR